MDADHEAGGVPEMAEIVRVGGQEFKKRNIEPILALLGVFFLSLWTLYVQEMLNRIWDAYVYGGSAPQPAGPPAVPPPPA
jgi:hypothetical protein